MWGAIGIIGFLGTLVAVIGCIIMAIMKSLSGNVGLLWLVLPYNVYGLRRECTPTMWVKLKFATKKLRSQLIA